MTGTSIEEQFPLTSKIDHSEPTNDVDAIDSDAELGGVSLTKKLLRPRTIVSFVIALAVVGFALTRFNLDLGAVFTQMSHANPVYLLLAFATYYGSFTFRAARWRSILQSADIKPAEGKTLPNVPQLSVMYILGWFANCIVPAKLGDAYRGYLLKQRTGTPFGSALGTIFAERLADMMTLGLVLVATAFIVFGRHIPSDVSMWMYVAIGLALALIVGVLVVYRFRHFLRGFVPARVRDHYITLEEGALGSFGRIPDAAGFDCRHLGVRGHSALLRDVVALRRNNLCRRAIRRIACQFVDGCSVDSGGSRLRRIRCRGHSHRHWRL